MKKRSNLIENGKYNRSSIMQQAWRYVRRNGWSLSSATSEVWSKAKELMKEYKWSLSGYSDKTGPLIPVQSDPFW